jgi:hypothetical protein
MADEIPMLDVYDAVRARLEQDLRNRVERRSEDGYADLTPIIELLEGIDLVDRLYTAEFRRPRQLAVHNDFAPDVDRACQIVRDRMEATGHSAEVCDDAAAAVRSALTA